VTLKLAGRRSLACAWTWQSLFGFGANAKVNISLTGYDARAKKEVKGGKDGAMVLPIYEGHEVGREARGWGVA
jgi:hypothetical protein